MKTYKQIEAEAKGLFRSLEDCSGLRDLEGFSGDLYALSQEAETTYTNDPDSDERLEALAEALAEAASALSDMADSYTEAHLALSGVLL